MAARPTPFGLFAGCGVGTVGDRTRLRLRPIAEHGRHTRLDNAYLDRLADGLGAQPEIRGQLRYLPNSSLYELAGQIRYVEPRPSENGRTYDLVVLEADPFLRAALQRARGWATATQIASTLVDLDDEITMEDAQPFVDSLIDSRVLVSELEPNVTGAEPIHGIIEALERVDAAGPAAQCLREVRDTLTRIDEGTAPESNASGYQAVRDQLATLPADVGTRHLFQTDMQLGIDQAQLDRRILPELVEAATLLCQIRPGQDDPTLSRFCQDFEQRYERREVPLLEALDEDCGIGFGKIRAEGIDPEPLASGINFPALRGPAQGRTWGALEEMLLHRIEALPPGELNIDLSMEDFDAVPRRSVALPDSFALNITLAAPDASALERGEHRAVLHSVEGPSGMNWLGRFCHADPRLEAHVRRAVRQEEALRPDAVFAEVVHLPEGRVGNVLLRPVLRDYEIPYLGRSGAPHDHQIDLDDLVVTVWDGRIVLKSKRLGREVVPRLTSAHAYGNLNNVGVYRFLCSLQTAGRPIRTLWSWGALDAGRTFLPRVTLGRVVLSLARWALKPGHLEGLRADTQQARWEAAQALRDRLRLPRWICLTDGDNALPVDLDNRLSVESFAQLLRRRMAATLTEHYPTPDDACVHGPAGPMSHEMVVPFVRSADPELTATAEPTPWFSANPPATIRRVLVPGSECLYTKLYASPRSCDRALLHLAPLLAGLRHEGLVDRWFFLRMSDTTGWHLRLRMFGPAADLSAKALPRLGRAVETLMQERVVWKMQVDSYQREVEHWGGAEGMELAERFLCSDSEAVLAILGRYQEDPAGLAEARWQLALRGVDAIWAGLGLDMPARHELADRCREGFAQQLRVHAGMEKRLSLRYRGVRSVVEHIMQLQPQSAHPLAPGVAIVQHRTEALEPVFQGFIRLDEAGRLNRPLAAMADRFSHLHVNRILRSMLREQEFMLMDFASRYYRSTIARARKASSTRARPEGSTRRSA
ncbi:MAG: lantibiotic dehydratase [Deltaproteobacteria bacterium]|nr:lantibiotic dehydratase [Deltaproteobacteria bacterium]